MVPATTKEELDKVLLEHPEIKEIYIDGVERPVQRSLNYKSQEKDYSGKKKRHTQKNMIVAGDNKMVLGIGETVGGKIHDYTFLKKTGFMESLIGYILWVDLGFQGIKNDYPNHIINIPKKNYKSKPLTQEEKDENWIISSIRVIVENIIGWAKKYRIIANKYRNRTRGEFKTVRDNRKHMVMQVVCGLYNLGKSKLFIS